MLSADDQLQFFDSILFESLGYAPEVLSFEFVSGGCINNTLRLNTKERPYFVKFNVYELQGMFEAEAQGLELLRQADALATPEVIAWGKKQDKSYLILEYIDSSIESPTFWEDFGQGLARLHRHTYAKFGLDFDNYIGSLTQSNEPMADGIEFFREKRLKAQAGKAMYEERLDPAFYQEILQFAEKLPNLIPQEAPALLHGDLWSGNYMCDPAGAPLIIDPAVYYGYREAELAFTQLFGGFEPRFYQAYQEAFPLEPGYAQRKDIYNLYPLLVHLNIFGSGYLSGIQRIIRKYK